MKPIYNNQFLNQYSNANVPSGTLPGLGIGAAAGGGLGALFAKLAGGNPLLGTLGAIPGAAIGAGIGNSVTNRQNVAARKAAFANLDPTSQQQALTDFAQAMDVASGTNAFTQALTTDPTGLEELMLKNA